MPAFLYALAIAFFLVCMSLLCIIRYEIEAITVSGIFLVFDISSVAADVVLSNSILSFFSNCISIWLVFFMYMVLSSWFYHMLMSLIINPDTRFDG
jgi:hypothetical protein